MLLRYRKMACRRQELAHRLDSSKALRSLRAARSREPVRGWFRVVRPGGELSVDPAPQVHRMLHGEHRPNLNERRETLGPSTKLAFRSIERRQHSHSAMRK